MNPIQAEHLGHLLKNWIRGYLESEELLVLGTAFLCSQNSSMQMPNFRYRYIQMTHTHACTSRVSWVRQNFGMYLMLHQAHLSYMVLRLPLRKKKFGKQSMTIHLKIYSMR